MKRAAVLVVLLAAGCSTAPLADVLDFCFPGQLGPEQGAPFGGVVPAAPPANVTPPPPLAPPPDPPPSNVPVPLPPGGR
jgi:hypothetical protein